MKCNINESLNSLSLILVPLNVNGNRHMFLFDTGSQQNGVSDASTECMKCFEPSGNLMSTQGLDGHTIVTPIGQMSYEIGSHTCKTDFFVISGKTFEEITAETGIEISGIFGINFMKKHRCTINIVEGYVTAEFDEPTAPDNSVETAA